MTRIIQVSMCVCVCVWCHFLLSFTDPFFVSTYILFVFLLTTYFSFFQFFINFFIEERYMGLPSKNVEGYKSSSVLSHTNGMAGKLLLVHGLIDENVHFRHTGTYLRAHVRTALFTLSFYYACI